VRSGENTPDRSDVKAEKDFNPDSGIEVGFSARALGFHGFVMRCFQYAGSRAGA
jgi:hypothetical protein